MPGLMSAFPSRSATSIRPCPSALGFTNERHLANLVIPDISPLLLAGDSRRYPQRARKQIALERERGP
jgi:hypothetical protein